MTSHQIQHIQEEIKRTLGKPRIAGYELDTELGADDWLEVIDAYKGAVEREKGKPFPQSTSEQLWGAIAAVFGSWQNARAKTACP